MTAMAAGVTVWDPLRKKEVALTPEEQVRQWFITVLRDTVQVPEHMMMSEVAFSLGSKRLRADIVIYDRQTRPLMVVECKRPEIVIDSKVMDQAVRYNMVLNVRYIAVTNGKSTFLVGRPAPQTPFSPVSSLPLYEDMISNERMA